MNPSALFIARPVATTLLTFALALAGFFAFLKLPVAPLPQVDYPTITVNASMPGASPATMAATVATPLERHLGIIANVVGMSSESSVGITRITLQFSLNRSLDGAARDVQAAINASRADLPTSLRQNPSFYKVNPAAAPVAILAMTSETMTRGQIYDAASRVVQQALSQIEGVGQVQIGGSSSPAVRVEVNPLALFKYGIGLEDVRAALAAANAHSPKGAIEDGGRRLQIYTNDRANHAEDYRPLVKRSAELPRARHCCRGVDPSRQLSTPARIGANASRCRGGAGHPHQGAHRGSRSAAGGLNAIAMGSRAEVLEVRIHLPPAKSRPRTSRAKSNPLTPGTEGSNPALSSGRVRLSTRISLPRSRIAAFRASVRAMVGSTFGRGRHRPATWQQRTR